jgi:hypothetical protein
MTTSYTATAGYQCEYWIVPGQLILLNAVGNSGSIAGKPVKVLITYEE